MITYPKQTLYKMRSQGFYFVRLFASLPTILVVLWLSCTPYSSNCCFVSLTFCVLVEIKLFILEQTWCPCFFYDVRIDYIPFYVHPQIEMVLAQSYSVSFHYKCMWCFLLRELEIYPRKKIWDPAEIWTQDLLNTRQTLLPLSHSNPWQKSGRQAT